MCGAHHVRDSKTCDSFLEPREQKTEQMYSSCKERALLHFCVKGLEARLSIFWSVFTNRKSNRGTEPVRFVSPLFYPFFVGTFSGEFTWTRLPFFPFLTSKINSPFFTSTATVPPRITPREIINEASGVRILF